MYKHQLENLRSIEELSNIPKDNISDKGLGKLNISKCCKCGELADGIFIRFEPKQCILGHKKFTHQICDNCWYKLNPGVKPVRAVNR